MPDQRYIRRLPDMRDASAEQVSSAVAVATVCREMFARRGYDVIETPLLEETELFVRQSGGELASRLYSFTEPGGFPVSLRPEYTAPVLRHAIETGELSVLPLRYQYSGPVFRHVPPADGLPAAAGQFAQIGAELIGGSAPLADGEIIGMAWQGLAAVGAEKPSVVLGHVGLTWEVLGRFGISERARLFLVHSLGKLKSGGSARAAVRADASDLGLLASTGGRPGRNVTVNDDNSLRLVESVLGETLGEPVARYAGTRTSAEIVARLARKLTMADIPEQFDAALGTVADLASISGGVAESFLRGEAVLREHGQDGGGLSRLEAVLSAATAEGVPAEAISVDFSLARGIAYYTGVVFDLYSGGRLVGGGGRYDGLPRALGADSDVPALGFAYNLDMVMSGLHPAGRATKGAVLVVAAGPDATAAAVSHASALRALGEAAVLEVEMRTAAERTAFARMRQIHKITTVTSSGRVTEQVL